MRTMARNRTGGQSSAALTEAPRIQSLSPDGTRLPVGIRRDDGSSGYSSIVSDQMSVKQEDTDTDQDQDIDQNADQCKFIV